MSHMMTVKVKVKDLKALELAAAEVGCELVQGVQTYRWFGRFVGDSPLPEGVTVEELGKCHHVIRVKGATSHTYEVGVKANNDGSFTLLYDFWAGGYGLEAAVGKGANKLMQAYSTHAATRLAQKNGYRVQKTVNASGKVVLTATR